MRQRRHQGEPCAGWVGGSVVISVGGIEYFRTSYKGNSNPGRQSLLWFEPWSRGLIGTKISEKLGFQVSTPTILHGNNVPRLFCETVIAAEPAMEKPHGLTQTAA